MKKFAIALSIIILLATLSPGFSIIAQPTHTPHENPAFAKDSPDPVSLLQFYGNVYDLAATEFFTEALNMLSELEDANIPEDPRDLIDLYSSLSGQLFTTLDDLEYLFDEIVALIADCPDCGTRQKIDDATVTIQDAQFMLDDIFIAYEIMSDKLAVFTAVAGSPITLSYDRLTEAMHRVGQLIVEFGYFNDSLDNLYEIRTATLLPVELSLNVTPTSVFVGDNITASGRLTADGKPLANKKLTLLLDNESSLVVTTDLNGSYAANITIPYKYVSTMTLKTAYKPSDSDVVIYQPRISQPVVIDTLFYTTSLELLVPEAGFPGLPVTISGQISPIDGAIERTVKVLLDNTQFTQVITSGQFDIQITPPPQISTGKHSLTVIVTPQERYAGVSKSLALNISKIPIQVEIQKPLFVIVPNTIEVSGEVHYDQSPLTDARVKLTLKDFSTTVKTSIQGSFTATIEIPLDLSLVGAQELEITIEPVEPWYSSLQITRRIFAINPAIIGLSLVAFVSLGLLVFKRARTRHPGQRKRTVISEAGLREPLIVAPVPRPGYEFSGARGRALLAYLNGLGVVEKVTGILMAPHTTLREFRNAAALQLPTAIKPFTELTLIAENVLYSAHKLDESTAAKAEQLAAIIKEELYSGAA